MKAGDVVHYRGPVLVYGEHRVEPGAVGEVIAIHRVVESWFAVKWEGMPRPTFHLIEELEQIED
jgi:hypothetical protein